MCTVTWFHTPEGFELFCNRDESRSRQAATSPEASVIHGRRYLAPKDGNHGGTWVAVNELGLGLALLNRYTDMPSVDPARRRSRGLLVLDLMASHEPLQVGLKLQDSDLTMYEPFRLLALASDRRALLWVWDGVRLSAGVSAEGHQPLSSSGYDAAGAETLRSRLLAEALDGSTGELRDLHLGFHRSHGGGEPSALTPCMHRGDAVTVSCSHLIAEASSVTLHYSAGSPCLAGPVETATLVRRPLPSAR